MLINIANFYHSRLIYTGHFFLAGLKLDIILKGKPLMKDGKTYWEVNVFEVVFNPTKAKFEYTGLFNGDKKLGM